MESDLVSTAEDQKLQQLCFNRTHFQRADFNVERFVNLARKRATLDQLHTDLRTYLRYLQNSMVELINDDYADFVNLSSGLAALRESVTKVGQDVQTNWSQFGTSIAELEKCSSSVEHSLTELTNARRKQAAARDQLALLQSIQQLHTFLARGQPSKSKQFNASWYSKLILLVSSVELWSTSIPKETEIVQKVESTKSYCYKQVRELLVEELCKELLASAKEENGKMKKWHLTLLLAPLQMLNNLENAVWRVASTVIAPRIGEATQMAKAGEKQPKDDLLKRALEEVIKLRRRWVKHAKQSRQYTEEISNFLDTCLLNFIISFLEKHFSTVLVPSDARLFHRCYQLVVNRFILQWPSHSRPHQLALLNTIRDKFNLVVYFKLASQPLLQPLKEQSIPEAFTFNPIASVPSSSTEGDGAQSLPCLCPYSNSLLSALDAIYSPELFLPSLANKAWEFTLQRMQNYAEWAQTMLINFTSSQNAHSTATTPGTTTMTIPTVSSHSNINAATTTSSGRKSASPIPHQRDPSPVPLLPPSPKWILLAALHRDMQLFDAHLFQFCLSTIWVLLRQIRIDPTPFGQCLSHFSEQLAAKRREIQQALVHLIGGELAKCLAAVSEVPRQYRWTKRPQPVGFSPYLATAFDICEQFGEETAHKLGWETVEIEQLRAQAMASAVGDFCERAEKVLDAVEQTGSSLLRFKQRKAAATGQSQSDATTESDEAKIRAQLCFDTNLVRQRAQEYGTAGELERLERIEQRASSDTNIIGGGTNT